MRQFIRAALSPMVLAGILGISACAPREEFPDYPDSISQSAHQGPWVAALAPLEAAYNRRDDAEVERLINALRPQFRAAYGEDSVPYAEIQTYAALQLYRNRNDEASLEYFRDGLERYRAALGPNHRDVALALHTYADALLDARGDRAATEAELMYREAYAIRLATLGPANIETLGAADGAYDAMKRQTSVGQDTQSAANTFIGGALEAAAGDSLDTSSRLRLLELLVEVAADRQRQNEPVFASRLYLQARQHLLRLPRSAWTLADTLYPGLITSLQAQGKASQASLLELEYLAVRTTAGL